jgi:hypothetical protein
MRTHSLLNADPVDRLRRRRVRLWRAYILHVGWLTSSVAAAATDAAHVAVTTSLLFTLVTVPPVLVYTVLVHRACRAIDPSARSAGLVHVILFTVFLTPFESGLILPARNLLVSRRILRAFDKVRQVMK